MTRALLLVAALVASAPVLAQEPTRSDGWVFEPVDFRKGIDSLAGVVWLQFQVDPFTGTLFVFRNRSGGQ